SNRLMMSPTRLRCKASGFNKINVFSIRFYYPEGLPAGRQGSRWDFINFLIYYFFVISILTV
ncbi:MAG: hypothetical protein V1928_00355, partial [Parcubacteria group bacterium]